MAFDLRQLRQFVAVAEELHFGRAATRLNMSQPPLSQSIKRLEADIGCALLERNNRKVELTPAGLAFLEEARKVLMHSNEALQAARRAGSDELAAIRVTFVSAALFNVLPEAIRQFRSRYPGVRIALDERPTDQQIDDLMAGKSDVAIIHPPVRPREGLRTRTLAADTLVAAVPAGDDLSQRRSLVLADLAEQPFVLFPYAQGPALHKAIFQACRAAGFQPRVEQEARQLHTILSLVASGLGVSLVPESAKSLSVRGVKYCKIEGLKNKAFWELGVAWRERNLAIKPLREFMQLLDAISQPIGQAGTRP